MHCVVTGVAGFVGSSICERLLSEGHTVTGIDCFVDYYPRAIKENNLQTSLKYKTFSFLEENLLTVDMIKLLDGAEWIFHQAAQAGVRASWGSMFEGYSNNNIVATQRLLEHAKKSRSLKKIVYASSSSVYGDAESYPTTEDLRPRPVSPYGVTKLAGEHLMVLYSKEFSVPTVSLRYFTVFGPRQRPDMAFNRFIKAALQGEELTLFGDGEQSRDFTFISDIVEANILAAQKGVAGAVLNIGGGTNATVNQVLDILGKEIGSLKINRQERQSGDARKTSADCRRASEMLGFSPRVSLKEGVIKEIEWMKGLLA